MKLPARALDGEAAWVVVETPAGSRIKYKWDAAREALVASRLLPAGMAFPHDFGWFPGTRAADGDPLDVMVLSDAPLLGGTLVRCRLLGGFAIRQSQEPAGGLVDNDRILAVPMFSPRASDWRTLDSVGGATLALIQDFLRAYVEVGGRRFEMIGPFGAAEARAKIEAAAD